MPHAQTRPGTLRRHFVRPLLAALATLPLLVRHPAQAEALPSPADLATRARQPVALALSQDGTALYVANRRSGSLSVIATSSKCVVAEHDVGKGLSDLGVLPDGRMLAVDRAAGLLLLLDVRESAAQLLARLPVAAEPVTVKVAPDGQTCVVASLWSRRLTFVAITELGREHTALTVSGTLGLPFSPRDMVLVAEGSKLVVADAFGGKLAVVDFETRALEAVRELPAHGIRGLGLSPDGQMLLVAHQSLNRAAKTDFEDVHWGRLLRSHLRSLRIDAVLTPGSDDDLTRGGCLIDLGFATSGAADPSGLACGRRRVVAVALGGVDEVAIGRNPIGYVRRYPVGAQPSALVFSSDEKTLYVADASDDTISALDARTGRRISVIKLGPRPEPTLVERGERLFYDAKLSHDGWMSCHTCHTDGHTNGRLGDTLGDGAYGAPKRIPSLLGTAATGPWAWNGSVERIEHQVLKSIEVTMWGRKPADDQVAALTAYLRSLEAPPAQPPVVAEAAARGRALFRSRECATCHAPPAYTSAGRYDVGLLDEAGHREFNPPSLLGVGSREPLLHDGRAATLEQVFVEHGHPDGAELSPDEAADLAAFLRTL